MTSAIYLLTNKVNGKIYVGKAIDFDRRIRVHSYAKSKGYIGNAIRKYGWENFSVSILENGNGLTNSDLLRKEKEWIDKLNSSDRKVGYNLFTRGDPTGYKHTLQSRQNMSLAHIGNKHSWETRQKISQSLTGKKLSAQHRLKLCQARKTRDFSFRKRKVVQIDTDGNIVKVWDSATVAAKELNGNPRNGTQIAASCSGRYKGKTFGFRWEYLDKTQEKRIV